MNWRDYSYLRTGDETQRQAYATLESLNLFGKLQEFDPALVSTVCLRLDVPGSDLDVICAPDDLASFTSVVRSVYGGNTGFKMWTRSSGERVAQFETETFPIEIFAKQKPVEQQYAWRHLSVMARLLEAKPDLREPVRTLKRKGMSTEESFATLLDLDGDPYQALLDLEEASDEKIAETCRCCTRDVSETASLSEEALAEDWNRHEEGEA